MLASVIEHLYDPDFDDRFRGAEVNAQHAPNGLGDFWGDSKMINWISERHIVALNYLLITILAYFAALAANDIVAGRSRGEDSRAGATSRLVDQAPSHSRSDYQAIVDRDIFNLEVAPVVAAPVVVEDLQLTLIGVSRMSRGKPFAILQDRRGMQAVYRVGEVIPDSGKLVAVERDRAIIERDGKKIAVELPTDEIAGTPRLRRLGIALPTTDDSEQVVEPSETDSSPDSSPDSSNDQQQ